MLVSIADVQALAETFAQQHIDEYLAELREKGIRPTRKEVNDALWGTISLSPLEISLLDSPLLQRLRYIHQLGVVHWVYPGALHTRFEHTLGVLNQVQHLTNALNSVASNGSAIPLIDKDKVQVLRISALMHDVGHSAFSHVSEIALQKIASVSTLSAEFSKAIKCEHKNLSEIFAYYVVRSNSFKTFLAFVFEQHGHPIGFDSDRERNVLKTIEMVSNAIIGTKIDDKIPLLHEIISGPFDADKLDYFVRDAKLAGTPSILDISRLVQKLKVEDYSSSDLPRDIAKHVAAGNDKHFLFGVKWSGVALLDELHLARVLLYAKIYRHPKVIAIEQMLRAAILAITGAADIKQVIWLLYTCPDDVLLNITIEGLASHLGISLPLSPDAKNSLENAVSILRSIRDRRLWVRAFALPQGHYPADPLERSQAQKNGLFAIREEIEHPEHCEDFKSQLLDEILKILNIAMPTHVYTKSKLNLAVMIHTLGQTPGSSQIQRALLMPPSGKPIAFREYTVNREAWSASYLSDQPAGYIFCHSGIADFVYLAMERLSRIQFNLRLPPSAIEASKRNSDTILELKRKLHANLYYSDAPYDLRPEPKRLLMADVPNALSQFSTHLSAYQEPTTESTQDATSLDVIERTRNWLRQFDDDDHISCALHILSRFRLITRRDITRALRLFIKENKEFSGARVIPFGSAKDSAVISTYFAADLPEFECTTLADAARASSSVPIIFIDDFVGTGKQGHEILAAGFGLANLKMDLGEQRSFFGEAEIELLKRVNVGFVFAAAWDAGISELMAAAADVGISAKIFRLLDETQIPFAFDGNYGDIPEETMMAFKERCAEIGSSLMQLSSDGSAKAVQKALERKLGYGNRAMLLASPFNVPSQTLTAIWASGTVENVDWSPLMARRKKL